MTWNSGNLLFRLVLGILIFIISTNFIVFVSPSPQRFSRMIPSQNPYDVWKEDIAKNMGPINYVVLSNTSEKYENIVIIREKIEFPMHIEDQTIKIVGELVYPADYYQYRNNLHGILLVHGIYSDREMMMPIAKKLVAEGFVVLAIDAAGHGESEFAFKPRDQFIPPVDDKNIKASLLYQVYLSGVTGISVLETLSKERFNFKTIGVMGISMGGLTAYMVAALDDRVAYTISMIAAGELSYAIYSGGVANALIPPDMDISRLEELDVALDPYYFADRINVPILITYSTHDEFFPLEGLVDTVKRLNTDRCYLKINPNLDHDVKEEDIDVAIEFIKKTVRNTVFVSKVKVNTVYLGLISIHEVEHPSNYDVALYWKAAIPGFPWIKSGGRIAVLPTLFPINYFAEARSPDNRIVITTVPEKINPDYSYIYLLVSLLISILIIYKVDKEQDPRWLAGKYLAFFLLLVSLVMPVAIYPDRFMVNMFHVLERFGTRYQLFIHESTYVLTALVLLSFSFSLENLQRLVYTVLSAGFMVLMALDYYMVNVAMGVAGFKPWIIPLTSIFPLILGNIILHVFYRRYVKGEEI